MSLIKLDKIGFKYDDLTVLKDVSFEVNEGDYICILGQNGAGKSTLMNIISGVCNQSSGEITFSPDISKGKIGYLSQQTEVQKNFPASVYEIVLSGCISKLKKKTFYSRSEKQIANYNINLLEIGDLKSKSFHELSGGQKQRVLLARTLCAADNVILLDEPVSGLDPIVTESFYETINHLNSNHNTTVIMVSHDVGNSVKNATHIIYLERDLFFYGKTEDFLKTEFYKKLNGEKNND